MNLRLLLALACAVTLAGWLASTAAACHSEIAASLDCQGNVSYTATAWDGSDATATSRTNSDVRVSVSTNGSTWTEIAKGHFGSDNGYKFSGTFSAGSATVVWVKVQELAHWGNGDAPAQARITKLTKGSCSTPPPTCPSANAAVTSSSSIMVTGTTANVTFTVAAGCKDIELTLVSYKAPGPTFDEKTADQQVLFDHKTQLFSAGSWQLEVAVPDCYYQVDFVYGKHIEKLGPAGTNNFYSKQGRLIRAANGGTTACTTSQPPPTSTPTPPPTLTPTPPPPVVEVAPAVVPPPAVSLVKTERVGGTGAFVRGPAVGKVGQRVFYRLTVTNPGTVPVSVTVKDPGCDAGTIKPVGAAVLNPGASFTFTCSHVLKARDGKQYVNVAVATATASNGAQATATSRVVANVAAGEVLGTQKTVKKKAKPKPKVKKVTKKAKPAKPVVVGASFTG